MSDEIRILSKINELEGIKTDLERIKNIYHSDDKIEYRAQKTNSQTKVKFPLTELWKYETSYARNEDGTIKIVNYFRDKTTLSIKDYEKMSERERWGWLPQKEREVTFSNNTKAIFRNNEVNLRIYDLKNNFESRYKIALDSLIKLNDRNIIEYNRRAEYSEKNEREGIRQILKRHFKVCEYEYNLNIDDKEISDIIYTTLRRQIETGRYINKGAHLETNTLYLKGFGRGKAAAKDIIIKVYSIEGRDEDRGYQTGDNIKIEITLKSGWFKEKRKKDEAVKVNDFTFQEKIYSIIKDEVIKYIKKYVYRPIKDDEIKGTDFMQALKTKLYARNEDDLFSKLFDDERVNSNIDKKLNKINREIINLKTRLDNIDENLKTRLDNIDERLKRGGL